MHKVFYFLGQLYNSVKKYRTQVCHYNHILDKHYKPDYLLSLQKFCLETYNKPLKARLGSGPESPVPPSGRAETLNEPSKPSGQIRDRELD